MYIYICIYLNKHIYINKQKRSKTKVQFILIVSQCEQTNAKNKQKEQNKKSNEKHTNMNNNNKPSTLNPKYYIQNKQKKN